jgi:FAD/FMN-containing dehydrogenase
MATVSTSGDEVTVGAGTRLGDLYDTLDGHGRTVPAGCGPTVGIAGLTLGGGLGILGRSHGLTLDHLLAARVVLADGRVVRCDEHHDSDLFWALRGAGGGNFGVVTSLTFRTVPAPPATTFHLVWPFTDAVAVLDAWQAWSPAGPDELAASLLMTASADVERPPVVNVFGALIGTRSDLDELLDDLVARVGTDPASAVRKQQSYRETKRHLAEHGPAEERPLAHPFSKSEYFRRPFPAEAIAGLLGHFSRGRIAGQSRELDFSPWGGAYNRVPPDATAFAHRDARFLLKQAVVIDPDTPAAGRQAAWSWLRTSWESVHPWGTGGVYPNFPDPDLPAWSPAYYGDNRERLLRIKAAYDPDGFFHGGEAPTQEP